MAPYLAGGMRGRYQRQTKGFLARSRSRSRICVSVVHIGAAQLNGRGCLTEIAKWVLGVVRHSLGDPPAGLSRSLSTAHRSIPEEAQVLVDHCHGC